METGGGLGLAAEALDEFTVLGEARVEDLERDLALQVTPLERSLTWHRILLGIHPQERAEWQASVPGWAAETAEPGPLDGVPGS